MAKPTLVPISSAARGDLAAGARRGIALACTVGAWVGTTEIATVGATALREGAGPGGGGGEFAAAGIGLPAGGGDAAENNSGIAWAGRQGPAVPSRRKS